MAQRHGRTLHLEVGHQVYLCRLKRSCLLLCAVEITRIGVRACVSECVRGVCRIGDGLN